MAPYPPTPLIIGSTTPSEAATATAASKAFPPSSMISNPARVASGCAELTMPLVPTAGRAAVFRLAGPSRASGPAVVAGALRSGALRPYFFRRGGRLRDGLFHGRGWLASVFPCCSIRGRRPRATGAENHSEQGRQDGSFEDVNQLRYETTPSGGRDAPCETWPPSAR